MHAEPAAVDALGLEEGAHEPAVAVVAHGRDDRDPHAEPGEAGGDVGGEPADVLVEALDILERRLELHRIQVDSRPPHDDGLGLCRRGLRRTGAFGTGGFTLEKTPLDTAEIRGRRYAIG